VFANSLSANTVSRPDQPLQNIMPCGWNLRWFFSPSHQMKGGDKEIVDDGGLGTFSKKERGIEDKS
jgi:hypothetical protein